MICPRPQRPPIKNVDDASTFRRLSGEGLTQQKWGGQIDCHMPFPGFNCGIFQPSRLEDRRAVHESMHRRGLVDRRDQPAGLARIAQVGFENPGTAAQVRYFHPGTFRFLVRMPVMDDDICSRPRAGQGEQPAQAPRPAGH